MKQTSVVFIYDHFHPDYSAGGPVTSLVNLAEILNEEFSVSVLTRAYEFGSGKKMQGIRTNEWNQWKGLSIWYADSMGDFRRALRELPAGSVLYLNGIFSPGFFLIPLWNSRGGRYNVVVSPRGMLQHGALAGGRFKKLVFIWLLNQSGLLKHVAWHATDEEEKRDIAKWFPRAQMITVIPNIPRAGTKHPVSIEKRPGELKLIYLSLIAEKKNLIFLIDLLNLPDFKNVTLEIVGPIKDKGYWEQCRKKINAISNPFRVRYSGEISPPEVSETISRNHVFALPSHGENYGHAIVEALGAFRPVIISDMTPWKDVEASRAGYALRLEPAAWQKGLTAMLKWDQSEFDESAKAAKHYFDRKINLGELSAGYSKLFRSAQP